MAFFNGHLTALLDGDFVVFLIVMRFNRPWKLRSWRVFMSMRPMVKELEASPQSGFLHAEYGFLFGGPALAQYWRSFEDLERYARNPESRHLPAWRRFNRLVRDSGDVGIWHETYRVPAGDYEVI